MRRIAPWIVAVPCAFLSVLSSPAVHGALVPMPGEINRLTMESRDKLPADPPTYLDVIYRRTLFRSLALDIYGPLTGDTSPREEVEPAPVVIFFHGGSWIHGDKITIRVVDRFLRRMREAGYYVISPNYTTSLLRGIGGPLENVRAAIRWVAEHAADYGWDVHHIGLYGVSAGGHLALMAASTTCPSDFTISFVFAECAPSDLVALRNGEAYEHSGNLRVFFRRRLAAFSPVNLVSSEMPPVLLFHGGRDRVVDIAQSERYAAALARAGGHVEFERYPAGNHAFLNLSDSQWYGQETRALRFFAEQFTHTAATVW